MPQLIKGGTLVDDRWTLLRDASVASPTWPRAFR